MLCKKCTAVPGAVILRKKDVYCYSCFITNTNHKFRAGIGKNKLLSRNEMVLICLSGGKASTVMLDFVYNGINQDIHKKLRINPIALHVIEKNDLIHLDRAESLIDQCKRNNIDMYTVHITDYVKSDLSLPNKYTIPDLNQQDLIKFTSVLNLTQTSKNDLLSKVKNGLFRKYASLLNCKYIFTAETTTTLAVNLLSNLSLGRGSQSANDMGFCDNRDESVKILRPLKDISEEELNIYIKLKDLTPKYIEDSLGNSLQQIIKGFVIDLHENYQSTISTVCKTAEKLGSNETNQNVCQICKSLLGPSGENLTALEATYISRSVSQINPNEYKDKDNVTDFIIKKCQPSVSSMFPLINDQLCYTCSKIYSEMDPSNFQFLTK